jgi:hypothetical protein
MESHKIHVPNHKPDYIFPEKNISQGCHQMSGAKIGAPQVISNGNPRGGIL